MARRARGHGLVAKLLAVSLVGSAAYGALALRARLREPAPVPATRAGRPMTDALTKTRLELDTRVTEAEGRKRGGLPADRRALLDAASRGDTEAVATIHGRGVALDGALEAAAASGNAALVTWLLDHGVDPKEGATLSAPPLVLADDHPEVVALLLARGAEEPPLDRAVAAGAPNAVRRVLARPGGGASAKAVAKDQEPLLVLAVRSASGDKRRAIVTSLLAAGAPVEARSEQGESPLAVVVAQALEGGGDDAWSVAKLLVARGAKTSGDALAKVSRVSEHEEWLRVLLAGPLEPDATLVAVLEATTDGDVARVKRLAARGVAWHLVGKDGARNPLERAIADERVEVVRALLDAGAPLDDRRVSWNPEILTAIVAASSGSDASLEIVRLLLERGANPNARNLEGTTALFSAAQQGSARLVAMLLAKGARTDDVSGGMTPLEVAELSGHEEVAKLLVSRGARRKKGA